MPDTLPDRSASSKGKSSTDKFAYYHSNTANKSPLLLVRERWKSEMEERLSIAGKLPFRKC